MKFRFRVPAPRFWVPTPGSSSLPPGLGPASGFQADTSTTLLTGSGYDLQLISRVPPCSLKRLDTSCSLQHIDRSLWAVFRLEAFITTSFDKNELSSCVRARSLRSDRAVCMLGRYVATELGWSSVATSRPSLAGARSRRARSLRSDRAWLEIGRYVATEPCACSVAT
ncbi:hypothetical protein DY000_02008238 [Brassica cretica]|uniref:Uncharacterized protein n=1 Tax=Brassica cretica TaxID=69181 RepID=A0ABQ7C8S5_BRACR|nr:hypothetical protein DY000_02008238 [Brassica cretica]